jgi:hypothetical protein
LDFEKGPVIQSARTSSARYWFMVFECWEVEGWLSIMIVLNSQGILLWLQVTWWLSPVLVFGTEVSQSLPTVVDWVQAFGF